MTEQNQVQEPTLEQRLLQMGELNHLSRGVNKSKDPRQTAGLYRQLAENLAENDEGIYDEIYRNLRLSREIAMDHAMQSMDRRKTEIEPLYKDEAKNKILEGVIASMKDTLKDSKNKYEAALKLSQYFGGLFDIPELDQVTANRYARQEVEAKTGIQGVYDVEGSIDKYNAQHEANTLIQRIQASEYIEDIKEGDKVTGYKLNEAKLKQAMNDVVYGATMYTNPKGIEIKKQKEAEKKEAS